MTLDGGGDSSTHKLTQQENAGEASEVELSSVQRTTPHY